MLKLKLRYFGHLIWRTDSLVKTHAGKDSGQEEKGATEDEIVGWHHWLNGHKFEQTAEVAKDREAWRTIIHGVAMSQTQLSEETTKSSPRVLALSLPPFFFLELGMTCWTYRKLFIYYPNFIHSTLKYLVPSPILPERKDKNISVPSWWNVKLPILAFCLLSGYIKYHFK